MVDRSVFNCHYEVQHAFTVIEKLPTYPPELTDENLASLSKPARLTVQALWLANQDIGSVQVHKIKGNFKYD